ncbi:hypothetical protein AB1Y20_015898 [Prymnesium parvum]|uniref:tRNA-dihydrouridine(16/17) synthase [NAD(P)(+)] n=1 Tax=Prymnesium parvum TaxID=97485 RepID=A0AB34K2S3_PRYPA
MVGASELPFRLLARRHGAQLCYTPMLHAADFVQRAHAPFDTPAGRGVGPLHTTPLDAPLVAHFCGNQPAVLLAAARRAQPYVAAVDLNLGCPQRSAHAAHYGAFLLDAADRPLVLRIVSTLARGLAVPVFCKIRLLDALEDTLAFVRQLEDAGCALLAVHGRTRGDPMHRRSGPADLQQIAAIKRALRIPVLSNGNVRNGAELLAALRETGADGVMTAEGALDDPSIFHAAARAAQAERKRLRAAKREARRLQEECRRAGGESAIHTKALREAKAALRALPVIEAAGSGASDDREAAAAGGRGAALRLAFEYLALAEAYPPPINCVVFHVRRMCKPMLLQYELLAPLLAAATTKGVERVLRRAAELEEGRAVFTPGQRFVADPPEELALAAAMAAYPSLSPAEAEAAARAASRAASERKRRKFEERMAKKARAEGKPESHYLREGLAPPPREAIMRLRDLPAEERAATWKQSFGRHCFECYMDGRCPWELDARGCGFLHPGDDVALEEESRRVEKLACEAEREAACG